MFHCEVMGMMTQLELVDGGGFWSVVIFMIKYGVFKLKNLRGLSLSIISLQYL